MLALITTLQIASNDARDMLRKRHNSLEDEAGASTIETAMIIVGLALAAAALIAIFTGKAQEWASKIGAL